MNRTGFALSMMALVGAAAWAYHVNYDTQEALGRVRAVEAEIAAEKERMRVLEVEWARLNAPDRLRALVAAQNDTLMLMPIAPDHFKLVAEIPFMPEETEVAEAERIERAAANGIDIAPPEPEEPLPVLEILPEGAQMAATREAL